MNHILPEQDNPVAHAVTDLAGRFIAVDDSFCELVQRERSDVLNQTILDLTAEEYRPLNAAKLDLLRQSGTSFVIRKTYLRGDGAMQPVENTVSLLNGMDQPLVAATVRPLSSSPETDLAGMIAVAHLLLRERRTRLPSGLDWNDDDLGLLIAAYVLETEGAPALVNDLAAILGGDPRANLLRIWELVHEGVLVTDGKARTLEKASVRLSPAHMKLVERHLIGIAGR